MMFSPQAKSDLPKHVASTLRAFLLRLQELSLADGKISKEEKGKMDQVPIAMSDSQLCFWLD